MCFDLESEPPIPVISGGSITHADLVLEAADGASFAAFLATPEESDGVGVVVLPDVRGLYHFYEELALRFAERGYPAVALDYFGRTAGVSKRDDQFDFMPQVALTTRETIQADVRACVELLRSPAAGSCRAIFTIGFCFGGRNAWLSAAGGHGLAGAIGFYGMPGERNGEPGPAALAGEMTSPVLALQAGDDPYIPAAENAAFEQALSAAGVDFELVTYDGAPHSFFDRSYEEHAEASADAWRRVLAFIEQHA